MSTRKATNLIPETGLTRISEAILRWASRQIICGCGWAGIEFTEEQGSLWIRCKSCEAQVEVLPCIQSAVAARTMMICRFVDESCPDDCAHKELHNEIVDDDFGEHRPCILACECEYYGGAAYCIPSSGDDLIEPDVDIPFDGWP